MNTEKKMINSMKEVLFSNFDFISKEAFTNSPGTLPMIFNSLGGHFSEVENNHALSSFIAQNLNGAGVDMFKQIYVQIHIQENERIQQLSSDLKNQIKEKT